MPGSGICNHGYVYQFLAYAALGIYVCFWLMEPWLYMPVSGFYNHGYICQFLAYATMGIYANFWHVATVE